MTVISQRTASAVLAFLLIGLASSYAEAGWLFGRKSNDCCPVCEQEQPKKKKKSAIGAEDAPASGVVDLVPARFTTTRAEPRKDDDKPASADPEKVQEMEKKIKQIDLKVNELSLQIETLINVLENPKTK